MTTQAIPHVSEVLDELEIVAFSFTEVARNTRRGDHRPSTVDEGLSHLVTAMELAIKIENSPQSGGASASLLSIVQSFYELYLEAIRPDPAQIVPSRPPPAPENETIRAQGETSRVLVYSSVLNMLQDIGVEYRSARKAAVLAGNAARDATVEKTPAVTTH